MPIMRSPLAFAALTLLAVACTPSPAVPPQGPPPPQAPPATTAGAGSLIAAGRNFSCAVMTDGHAHCWGKNDLGQLGIGTRGDPVTKPMNIADLTDLVSIGAGTNHACALSRTGRVACWGWSEASGDEQHGVRVFPAEVVASGARSLSVGGRHDCIVTNDGAARCMGWGADGQLGNGEPKPSLTAVGVAGLDKGILAISAGEAHTCAVGEGGKLSCWGSARYGRLGNGASQTFAGSLIPVDVVNMKTGVASVAAGGDRTCALTTAGGVQCWGRWKPGRPLSDSQASELAATPMEVQGLSRGVTAITVGQAHACALFGSGAIKCWGWNERGQLGNGSTTDSEVPVDVQGISDAVAISAGYLHTCAMRRNGSFACWGDNGFGQLGNGTTKDSSTPVAVLPGT